MLACVFHPEFVPDGDSHFGKLAAVAAAVWSAGLGELHEPGLISRADLDGLHDSAYLDALWTGTGKLAQSPRLPWSHSYVRAVCRMLAGQELALSLAMQQGFAANLACGFHHAHPDHGGGFCALNGLAFLAHRNRHQHFLVLDCDEHGGDGTEAFCARLTNLEQLSLFGTRFGTRGGIRSHAFQVPSRSERGSDDVYLQALDCCLERVRQIRPDVLLYQAGMDVHEFDPKSQLKLSTDTIVARDQRVLRFCRSSDLPLVLVLAGAYQATAAIVDLYKRLFESAFEIYCAAPTARLPLNETNR